MKICLNCEYETTGNDRYCKRCGSELAERHAGPGTGDISCSGKERTRLDLSEPADTKSLPVCTKPSGAKKYGMIIPICYVSFLLLFFLIFSIMNPPPLSVSSTASKKLQTTDGAPAAGREPSPSSGDTEYEDTFWEPVPLSQGIRDDFESFNNKNWAIYDYDADQRDNSFAIIENGALVLPHSYTRSLLSKPVLFKTGDIIQIRRKIKVSKVQEYRGIFDVYFYDPENDSGDDTGLFRGQYNLGPLSGDIPADAFSLFTFDTSGNEVRQLYQRMNNNMTVEETFFIDSGTGKCKWILNDTEMDFTIAPLPGGALYIEMSNFQSTKNDNMFVYECSIAQSYES